MGTDANAKKARAIAGATYLGAICGIVASFYIGSGLLGWRWGWSLLLAVFLCPLGALSASFLMIAVALKRAQPVIVPALTILAVISGVLTAVYAGSVVADYSRRYNDYIGNVLNGYVVPVLLAAQLCFHPKFAYFSHYRWSLRALVLGMTAALTLLCGPYLVKLSAWFFNVFGNALAGYSLSFFAGFIGVMVALHLICRILRLDFDVLEDDESASSQDDSAGHD